MQWKSHIKIQLITICEDVDIEFILYIYIQGAHNKFPDFFRIGTFIDSTHMKL